MVFRIPIRFLNVRRNNTRPENILWISDKLSGSKIPRSFDSFHMFSHSPAFHAQRYLRWKFSSCTWRAIRRFHQREQLVGSEWNCSVITFKYLLEITVYIYNNYIYIYILWIDCIYEYFISVISPIVGKCSIKTCTTCTSPWKSWRFW